MTEMTEPRPTNALVGWVVDVQADFMTPPERGGRLYVRHLTDAGDAGAERALPAIERTVAWLRTHAAALVYTADWHAADDREIDATSPDPARGTYPPHCMGLSEDAGERAGAAILPTIAPDDDAFVLDRDATAEDAVDAAEAAVGNRAVPPRPVVIRKREFSVFDGNPAADAFVTALVDALEVEPEFVVCGVAADVCVAQAVDGLLARGRRVAVVSDAMWGLGLEPADALLARWAAAGARVVTSAELGA